MELGILVGAWVLAFIVISNVRTRILVRRKVREVFGSRDDLSTTDIVATYYHDFDCSKLTVAKTWEQCAARLKVPAGRLRPGDRFDRELKSATIWAAFAGDPPDLESLSRFASRAARKSTQRRDLKTMKTLDDLVRDLAKNAELDGGGSDN